MKQGTETKKKYTIASSERMQDFGKASAKDLLGKKIGEHAFVVTLSGELGSGKTTFVQGFAAGLGIKEKILSPTFVIVKSYGVPNTEKTLYHIDCYRIKDSKDLLELGWREIVQNPNDIILLEWPERAKGILPKELTSIEFQAINETTRQIVMSD